MYYGVFNRIFRPPDTKRITIPLVVKVKIISNIAKCPLGDKISPGRGCRSAWPTELSDDRKGLCQCCPTGQAESQAVAKHSLHTQT